MSVAWEIITAVQYRLQAAAPAGLLPASIVVRRRFEHDPLSNTANQLVVVGEWELTPDETTEGVLLVPYPILVGLVTGRENRVEPARFEYDVRQAVRRCLFVTHLTPDAPTVYNVAYDPRPSFSGESWKGNFDVSAQRFTYWSEEARNG